MTVFDCHMQDHAKLIAMETLFRSLEGENEQLRAEVLHWQDRVIKLLQEAIEHLKRKK